MKSLVILQTLLNEASEALRANTKRDWLTIQSRFKDEGMAFLTITLPLFASWFESSMESGWAGPSIRCQFRKRAGSGSVLPCFLHGLTSLVFDRSDGRLLDEVDVNAVFFIRQVCLLHKKLRVPCSPERTMKATEGYVQTDLALRSQRLPRGTRMYDLDHVLSHISYGLDAAFVDASRQALPKHGPGATADKLWSNAKYKDRTWLRRWNGIFSWEELYGFSTIHQAEGTGISPRDELPVKVISVPKTAKGPRIISVEPTAMQYAQQLVSRRLSEAFNQCGLSVQFNLNDQSVNQLLAKQASKDGLNATLDLSEASDRLSSKLVRFIFARNPVIRKQIFACRTSRARVGKLLIHLYKYASMGSALTFPLETYCFYAISVAAVYRYLSDSASKWGKRVNSHTIAKTAMKQVFVFGDDIIVPSASVEIVMDYLEAYGLKVNRNKSFWKGLFRESCGFDGYRGSKVTPVYCRELAPCSLRDAKQFVSWVSMANQFHTSGLWSVAEKIREHVDSIHKLPLVGPNSQALGWHHYTGAFRPQRWRQANFDWTVKAPVGQVRKKASRLDGYDALLKCQLTLDTPEDAHHLDLEPERFSLRLRHRTVTPY